MIGKSLLAAAALATSMAVALPASQAEAKTNVHIGIGLGLGGGYYGGYYPGYPVYDGYYSTYPVYGGYYAGAISCKKGARIVDHSGFHNVNAVDCSLPGYKYMAWRNGHKFLVRVNGNGNITGVGKIF